MRWSKLDINKSKECSESSEWKTKMLVNLPLNSINSVEVMCDDLMESYTL